MEEIRGNTVELDKLAEGLFCQGFAMRVIGPIVSQHIACPVLVGVGIACLAQLSVLHPRGTRVSADSRRTITPLAMDGSIYGSRQTNSTR